MSKFERLKIGAIGLTDEQSKMLQGMLAVLSNQSPLVQMGEEYDLVLKRNVNQSKL